MSKPIIKKMAEKPSILDQKQPINRAFSHQNSQALATKSSSDVIALQSERAVTPLSAEYTNLLAAPKSDFQWKFHILPVAAILIFSLVLVLFYHFNSRNNASNSGRGVAGDLTNLSNGQYDKQAADFTEEKTCIDHTDGTKTCTTKTKLHREFR